MNAPAAHRHMHRRHLHLREGRSVRRIRLEDSNGVGFALAVAALLVVGTVYFIFWLTDDSISKPPPDSAVCSSFERGEPFHYPQLGKPRQ